MEVSCFVDSAVLSGLIGPTPRSSSSAQFNDFAARFLTAHKVWAAAPTFCGGTDLDVGLAGGWLGWVWCLAQLERSGSLSIAGATWDLVSEKFRSLAGVTHVASGYFYGPFAEPLVLSLLTQLDRRSFRQRRTSSIRRLLDLPPARSDDLFTGTAGSVLALHQMWRLDSASIAPGFLKKQCRRLARALTRAMRDSTPMLGLAHGLAGLLVAAEAANAMYPLPIIDAFREWAVDILSTPTAVARGSRRALWPRSVGEHDPPFSSWCIGTPGMILAFSTCLRLTRNTVYQRLVDTGLTLLRGRRARALSTASSLCCGALGLASTYIEVFRLTGDPSYLHVATEIHERLDTRKLEHAASARGLLLSMHQGLLGLVYLWYELRTSHRLPSIGLDLFHEAS